MRYALKFAYDGAAFEGYARQPEMNTVEGEVIKALESFRIIDDVKVNNFQSASRTDRGVSAAGNVIAVNTDFDKLALIPALNSRLDGMRFWALAEVDEGFNPRYAKGRWYRYLLLRSQCPVVEELQNVAGAFIGEHDFGAFSKKDRGEENTVLKIDSIEIVESEDFIYIDFRAQRFLWQLVRRLVTAMLEGDTDGEGIGPMPAENLVLMDVTYDFVFNPIEKIRIFSKEQKRATVRAEAMNQITSVISSS
jgi:tRNA pseudouridine38-40 synthase